MVTYFPPIPTHQQVYQPVPKLSRGKSIKPDSVTGRSGWEQKYPWVYCNGPKQGMFCKLCQKSGNPPSIARVAWTVSGVQDWNHATEQLREHRQSKWHTDAVIYARMAEQGEKQSVLQLRWAAAVKEAEER